MGNQIVHNVRIPLKGMASYAANGGTLTVGTSNLYGFKAPAAADGGGITIVRCYCISKRPGPGRMATVALRGFLPWESMPITCMPD